MADEDPWAPLTERFVDTHYGSVHGRVRTYTIDQHLAPYLPELPASIVDVGGGAGTQSIPLARRGYAVTIVDSSPAMLARAEGAVEAKDQVRLVEAQGEDAAESLGSERFDAVLCHGVMMYLDDPNPMVASLSALASPGGIVSIVAKNRASLAVQPGMRRDWGAALAAFDATHQVNRMGLDTRADTVEGLSDLLEMHGVEPLEWFGVRLFTDGWDETEIDPDEFETLLAVELEATRRDPYRQLSRLFHLIGRKSVAEPPISVTPG